MQVLRPEVTIETIQPWFHSPENFACEADIRQTAGTH